VISQSDVRKKDVKWSGFSKSDHKVDGYSQQVGVTVLGKTNKYFAIMAAEIVATIMDTFIFMAQTAQTRFDDCLGLSRFDGCIKRI